MSTFIGIDRVPKTVNAGLFAQTAASTPVVNTTVETTILNSGVGNLSVPANVPQGALNVELQEGEIQSVETAHKYAKIAYEQQGYEVIIDIATEE